MSLKAWKVHWASYQCCLCFILCLQLSKCNTEHGTNVTKKLFKVYFCVRVKPSFITTRGRPNITERERGEVGTEGKTLLRVSHTLTPREQKCIPPIMMWSSFVFPSYFPTCLQVSYAISISNLSLIVPFWVVKHCASCQQTRVTDNRLWGIPSLSGITGWGFFAYFRQLTQRESICVLQAEIFKGLQIWLKTKTLLNSQWVHT